MSVSKLHFDFTDSVDSKVQIFEMWLFSYNFTFVIKFGKWLVVIQFFYMHIIYLKHLNDFELMYNEITFYLLWQLITCTNSSLWLVCRSVCITKWTSTNFLTAVKFLKLIFSLLLRLWLFSYQTNYKLGLIYERIIVQCKIWRY